MLCKRDGSKVKAKIRKYLFLMDLKKEKLKRLILVKFVPLLVLKIFDIGDSINLILKKSRGSYQLLRLMTNSMSMTFTINDSPFFGQDGKFVTSRQIKERLEKEEERNLTKE